MRHQVHTKKLNRSTGHRKALYRNLVQSLVEHERITTTLVKAKTVRPMAEKLITRAKKQDLAARRAVLAYLPTEAAAEKVYAELAPRFMDRPGGYTRIIKIGRRVGDGTEMAVLELVELSGIKTNKKQESTRRVRTKKQTTASSRLAKAKEVKADEVAEDKTEEAEAKE